MSSKKYPFTPIPFYIWLSQNQEDLEKQYGGLDYSHSERCHDCDGQGYSECDMGHEHECEYCDGEGKITDEQLFMEFARDQYNDQVNLDKKKYLKYEEFVSKCS